MRPWLRTVIFREKSGGSTADLPCARGRRQLPAFVERGAESLKVRGETGRIEGIERPHILEKLVQLGLNFRMERRVFVERKG
jgi:hypothetical protein